MASFLLLGFLFVINFLASIVLGVMAFGDVPLLHLVWQVTQQLLEGELVSTDKDAALIEAYPNDVMFVTVLSSLRNLFTVPYLAYLARDGFQPALFSVVTLCQCLTVAIGVELLARMDAAVLKPYLVVGLVAGAAILACMSLTRLTRELPAPVAHKLADDALYSRAVLVTTGVLIGAAVSALISGIATGLVGIGGPPILIFILYQQLPPQLVRGTYPAAAAVVAIVRAAYSAYKGQYHAELWQYYTVSCVAAVLGIGVGNLAGRKLEQWVFNIGVVCILFLTGVSMSQVTVEKLTSALSAVCLYIAVAVHLAKRQQWKAQRVEM